MVLTPIQYLWIVSAGLLGLLVGSFLNVCIHRMPQECLSLSRPRSRCPHCRSGIAWYDNVPVLSWLILRGQCRKCHAAISFRYPCIELLTGALFAWAAAVQVGRLDLWAGTDERIVLFVVHAWLISALVVSTFIDFDYKIIPDEITLSSAALAPVACALFPFLHEADLPPDLVIEKTRLAGLLAALVGMSVGAGIVWGFGKIGELMFRKEAMGLGDVKLMAGIGGFLGWKAAVLIFLGACIVGSVFGILIRIRTGSRYVAFGPYLAFCSLGMIFFYRPVMHFINGYFDQLK